MKKLISFVIVFTMIVSTFSLVSFAAVDLSKPSIVNPIISVGVKQGGVAEEYLASKSLTQNTPNAEFDFTSTLDMARVRAVFTNMYNVYTVEGRPDGGTLVSDDRVKDFFVFGSFEITITYPKDNFDVVTFENALKTDAVYDSLNSGMFYVKDINITEEASTKKCVLDIGIDNEMINLYDLHADLENKLADITLQINGAKVTSYGQYPVTVDLSGKTWVCDNESGTMVEVHGSNVEWVNVNYECDDVTAIAIVTPPSTGGGGSKRYTLTYESNGGTFIPSEIYIAGTNAELTKVPKKDGYIFDGWHLDEELTEDVTEVKMNKNITVYANWIKDNGTAGNGYDTPDILNGDDHFAYVVGYPDGTVRPNDNITRAEVTAIFFRLLKEEIRTEAFTQTNNFADVNGEDWYNNPVSTMTKLGIVNGRYEGGFVPDAFITRAEFAAICARFDDSEFEIDDEFTDVAGHWAEAEIHEAAAHGWIRGYEDNSFKPDQFITRAEAMTMINRVLNRVPEAADDLLDDMIKWPDNSDVSAWYYLPVQEATNSHDYDKKNNIYEKWTSLRDVTDWTEYEK